jgi:hypothetical protein
VLVRQAMREVERDLCDVAAATAFVQTLSGLAVRCRFLAQPSPFVDGWAHVHYGPAEVIETPNEALRRLHASLTGAASRPAC